MGMLKKTVVFCLCLALPLDLFAQEMTGDLYQATETIDFAYAFDSEFFHFNYTMFSGLLLRYKDIESGLMFGINGTMRTALLEFTDSSMAYNSYRRRNIGGNVLIFGGLAMSIGGFVPLMNSSGQYSSELAVGLSATGLISIIVGSILKSSAMESIFTAVNVYNRNIALNLSR